jgi:hypothetical protein
MSENLFWPWRGGTLKEKVRGLLYAALLVLGYATLHAAAWWLGGGP